MCAFLIQPSNVTRKGYMMTYWKIPPRHKERGIILAPTEHLFESYVDADFCGLWNPETAMYNPMTSKSHTGFVIMYAGCPST
jgi:hypothetical protein